MASRSSKAGASTSPPTNSATSSRHLQDFTAIPYYAWANRGPGEMTVWIPTRRARYIGPDDRPPSGRRVVREAVASGPNAPLTLTTDFGVAFVAVILNFPAHETHCFQTAFCRHLRRPAGRQPFGRGHQPPARTLSLDANWKFHLGDDWPGALRLDKAGASGGPASEKFNDTTWRPLDLPHDWAIELPFDKNADTGHGFKPVGPGFNNNSVGWYRRTFDLPATDAGKRIWLNLMACSATRRSGSTAGWCRVTKAATTRSARTSRTSRISAAGTPSP